MKVATAGAVGAVVVTVAVSLFFALRRPAPGVHGSGVSRVETFAVERFDRVSLHGVGTALIALGEPQRLQVTADDNLFAVLAIGVTDGALTIRGLKEIRPTHLMIEITVPDLRSVALAGNPKVKVPAIARDTFGISITGNGTAEVAGATRHLTVKVTGNGLVRAAGLVARLAEVEIAGAGDVEVHATEALTVTCSGSGSVRYRGDPRLTVRGPASVERSR